MRGDKVEELQHALAAAGHDPGPIDGIFGSLTSHAVKAFQRRHGLVVDGIVGPNTAGRLDAFALHDGHAGASPPPLGPMTDWPSIPIRTRRVRAMTVLIDRYGYPVNGAAGIVGNLEAESGIIPNRVQGSTSKAPMTSSNNHGGTTTWTAEQIMNRVEGQTGPKLGGIGLAQWTFRTRREGLFRHRFQDVRPGPAVLFDMDAQLDYLVHELQSQFKSKVDDVIRSPGVTVDKASDLMLTEFERPADMGTEQQQKRRAMAEKARHDYLAASGASS
jgi:peptidoglycan hydrolase-like protein with peptidoglycan-binding domain